MADKKKEEKIKAKHDEYLDKKVDKIFSEWKGLHTKESMEARDITMQNAADVYYDMLKTHLGDLHGKDDDGKPLKYSLEGYKDMQEGRKRSQKMLHKMTLHHIERDLGKGAAKIYSKNLHLLEGYISQTMNMHYDQVIDVVAKEKDLSKSRFMMSYMQKLAEGENKEKRKIDRLEKHLHKAEHKLDLAGLTNKEIQHLGYEFKKSAEAGERLGTLQDYFREGSISPTYYEEAEHIKKYKQKKK